MTIDTIKNVLMRIMTINQNLTEQSLHTLLIASGWDEQDIREGLGIFKSVRGGNDIADYQSSAKLEEIRNKERVAVELKESQAKTQEKPVQDLKADNQSSTKAETPKSVAQDYIFPYPKKEDPEPGFLDNIRGKILDHSNLEELNAKETSVDSDLTDKIIPDSDYSFPENGEPKSEDMKNSNENREGVMIAEMDSDKQNETPKDSLDRQLLDVTDANNRVIDKPIGLIVLDTTLFVLVLSLITYILIN
jgi:hypothetical protein